MLTKVEEGRRRDFFSSRSGFPLPVLNRPERAASEVATEILVFRTTQQGTLLDREARSRSKSGMLGYSLSSPLLLKHSPLSAIQEVLSRVVPPMRR
jgi:hypothetical protein